MPAESDFIHVCVTGALAGFSGRTNIVKEPAAAFACRCPLLDSSAWGDISRSWAGQVWIGGSLSCSLSAAVCTCVCVCVCGWLNVPYAHCAYPWDLMIWIVKLILSIFLHWRWSTAWKQQVFYQWNCIDSVVYKIGKNVKCSDCDLLPNYSQGKRVVRK